MNNTLLLVAVAVLLLVSVALADDQPSAKVRYSSKSLQPAFADGNAVLTRVLMSYPVGMERANGSRPAHVLQCTTRQRPFRGLWSSSEEAGDDGGRRMRVSVRRVTDGGARREREEQRGNSFQAIRKATCPFVTLCVALSMRCRCAVDAPSMRRRCAVVAPSTPHTKWLRLWVPVSVSQRPSRKRASEASLVRETTGWREDKVHADTSRAHARPHSAMSTIWISMGIPWWRPSIMTSPSRCW